MQTRETQEQTGYAVGYDLSSLPRYSAEDEAALVERARLGDEHARHCLILLALRQAGKRIWQQVGKGTLRWRIEEEDVMQHLYLMLWERAVEWLAAPSPCASMQYALLKYVARFQSLILVAESGGTAAPLVGSLDVLVRAGEDGETVLDRLAAPAWQGENDARDYQALYEAINQLPARQRQAIIERYGLEMECGGAGKEILSVDQRKWSCTNARERLRKALRSAYPQYAGDYRRVQIRPVYADRVLKDEQVQRLRQAYEEMKKNQERISIPRLARRARIDLGVAGAYLYAKRAEESEEVV